MHTHCKDVRDLGVCSGADPKCAGKEKYHAEVQVCTEIDALCPSWFMMEDMGGQSCWPPPLSLHGESSGTGMGKNS